MTDRDTERAVDAIAKAFDVVAIAEHGSGDLLVIIRSDITSRARRNAAVRDAMGRRGRRVEISVYTPEEVLELAPQPESGLADVLATCRVIRGSLDGLAPGRGTRI